MQIQRLTLISLPLCLVLAGVALGQNDKPANPEPPTAAPAAPAAVPAVPPPAPTIGFARSVSAGRVVNITGATSSVSIFKVAANAGCPKDGSNPPDGLLDLRPDGAAETTRQFDFDSANPKPLPLESDVQNGDSLCLVAYIGDGLPFYSHTQAVVGGNPPPPVPKISFDGVPAPLANSVFVKGGAAKDSITIYAFAVGYKPKNSLLSAAGDKYCVPADRPNATDTLASGVALTNSDATAITLKRALAAGEQLCIRDQPASGDPEFSYFATVTQPPVSALKFTSALVTGASTFSIQGDTSGEIVSIYLFGAGYWGKSYTCLPDYRSNGTPLTMVGGGTTTANAATSTTSTVTIATANMPQAVTLSKPLVAGTRLCLFGSPAAGGGIDESSYLGDVAYFAPGEDYGRFAVNLTGGVMISNEERSSNSTTASQYFDIGLSYTLKRPPTDQESKADAKQKLGSDPDPGPKPIRNWVTRHDPGASTLMDIRLTTIPVAASTNTQTNVSPTPTTTTTTLTQSLNVLSSQQAANIVLGMYFPFRMTHWYRQKNWITGAPLVQGGFATLLNPTTTTSSGTSDSAVSSTTQSNFSSVYNFFGIGARFAWDIYPKSTDEAPIEYSWVSFTLGQYSNLPSWKCTELPGSPAPSSPPTGVKTYTVTSGSAPVTSCPVYPATSTGPPYTVYASRTLVPRVDIAGELKLPNYPVVFGYDANLGQYWSSLRADKIDIDNKPGNDVRFYFGLKFNIGAALKKLGVPSS